MTAINVIRFPTYVCLLTDGAMYQADGTMTCTTEKTQTIAHLRTVLAARGPSLFLPLVAEHLSSRFDTFDALIQDAPLEVARGFGQHSRFLPKGDATEFELFIAGWSESRDRGESYVLFNHERYGADQAWVLHELGPVCLAPGIPELEAMLTGGALDPVQDGLRIIEHQRALLADGADGAPPKRSVGGFAQLTTVSAGGIQAQVLRRWPDRPGEKLGLDLAS